MVAVVVGGDLRFRVAFEFDDSVIKVLAILSVLLYLVAPLVILRHLLRRDKVDARTILGAVAIYLMLGMMFAFTYRAISLWQTQPFFGTDGPGNGANASSSSASSRSRPPGTEIWCRRAIQNSRSPFSRRSSANSSWSPPWPRSSTPGECRGSAAALAAPDRSDAPPALAHEAGLTPIRTLGIDCGGSGIKGSVLDAEGGLLAERVRIKTPYPLPPERFIGVLLEIASQLPEFDRVTVGLPGMIRHGSSS